MPPASKPTAKACPGAPAAARSANREAVASFERALHLLETQPETRERLTTLQHYFMAHGVPDPATAMHQAVIAVGHAVRAQATVMGYSDCFGLLGVALLGSLLSVALLRKGAASGGGAH